MHDDPNKIVEHIIEEHGVKGALTAVLEGIAAAHASGDNYALSVWREVRRALRNKQEAQQGQPE